MMTWDRLEALPVSPVHFSVRFSIRARILTDRDAIELFFRAMAIAVKFREGIQLA